MGLLTNIVFCCNLVMLQYLLCFSNTDIFTFDLRPNIFLSLYNIAQFLYFSRRSSGKRSFFSCWSNWKTDGKPLSSAFMFRSGQIIADMIMECLIRFKDVISRVFKRTWIRILQKKSTHLTHQNNGKWKCFKTFSGFLWIERISLWEPKKAEWKPSESKNQFIYQD